MAADVIDPLAVLASRAALAVHPCCDVIRVEPGLTLDTRYVHLGDGVDRAVVLVDLSNRARPVVSDPQPR